MDSQFQVEDSVRKAANRHQHEHAPQKQNPLGRAGALGNATVQRVLRSLGVARAGGVKGGDRLDESLARAIQSKRGAGAHVDDAARSQLEPAFGHDFSAVRVHNDAESDALTRAVKADAFTTGSDIFFRSGKYTPGSGEGQKLLAHELTHVVQQSKSPPSEGWRVSDPGDASEREAASVAEHVSSGGSVGAAAGAVSRAGEEDELQMSASLDRAEEEDELQMSASLDRAGEEDELQMSASLDRAGEEDELQMSASLDRAEEEDELQMSASLDRAGEEDELQMSASLDRAGEEDELQMAPSLDRAGEEDELQMSPSLDRARDASGAARGSQTCATCGRPM